MKPEASSQKLNVEPEPSGAPDGESEQSGDRQSQPEQSQKEEDVEMTEDEKVVLNILNVSTPMDLSALKGQAGLSNKRTYQKQTC